MRLTRMILLLAAAIVAAQFSSTYAQDAKKADAPKVEAQKSEAPKPEAKKADGDHKCQYTCPMHPEVKSDSEGKCPKCGMALEMCKEDAKAMKSKMDCGDSKEKGEKHGDCCKEKGKKDCGDCKEKGKKHCDCCKDKDSKKCEKAPDKESKPGKMKHAPKAPAAEPEKNAK